MKNKDTYKETKVFEFPNATVRVHIPDITNDERNRRMKNIHVAAGRLVTEGSRNEGL